MNFSGENYILTPRTENLSFVFSNLALDKSTGIAELGFSGENQVFSFLVSGQRIIDPSKKFTYSYGADEQITISGEYNNSHYRYYINEKLVVDGITKQGFETEKFFAKTQDCQLSLGLQMFCPTINYSVEFDDNFIAGRTLNGRIINSSAIGFKILASELTQDDGVTNEVFTGFVTGEVLPLSTLDFELHDVSEILYDSEASSTLSLTTTLGEVSHDIIASRVSGYFNNVINFSIAPEGTDQINPYFRGSGDASGFSWEAELGEKQAYLLDYTIYGDDETYGEGMADLPKPLYFSLENVSPTNKELYTGTYVTSWLTYDKNSDYCTGSDHSCTDTQYTDKDSCETAGETWQSDLEICRGEIPGSGRYSGQAPTVEFLTYGEVTGVSISPNSLFSRSAPDKIPMLFSGYDGELGDGAAGYFLTELFDFTFTIDGNSPHPNKYNYTCSDDQYKYKTDCLNAGETWTTSSSDWRRITGYELTNFGTGYTKAPAVFAATGKMVTDNNNVTMEHGIVIGTPNAYDVAWTYGALYTFERFESEVHLKDQAAYLSGIPYFVETGNSIYAFSGMLITNPGSGYEPDVYLPRLRIGERQPGDPLGEGGVCSEAIYITKETCEAAGVCSDSNYTTKESCENASKTWTPNVWYDHGDNLSGEFLFNTKGTLYDFTGAWNLLTGIYSTGVTDLVNFRQAGFVDNEKYVDSGFASNEYSTFYSCVEFNNLDIDEPMVAKLIVTGQDNVRDEFIISGYNLYSTETGMAYKTSYVAVAEGDGAFNTIYFGG